uniref:Uncharacterized protein n=1 Tax=Leersia perrieri TaxID=77586 RepID=A0A0D9XBW4_9ORYZ
MGENNLGASNLPNETKESTEHSKDSFVGITKNDHIDHRELESSDLQDLGKKNLPSKEEEIAMDTKDVPEEIKPKEPKQEDLENKTTSNIGKRTRQDNSGRKTKGQQYIYLNQSRIYAGPTQYPRGRGPTRGNLPYGFV